ncbi:MAG: ParA family protein [Gemmatimonadota bacterium]|nr:ParA family protein [Gemmatimonadota bacterium]
MYVTTFYSFKGGVGRTMALVNVAVELAQRGRRVLAVDFDLEAPGLDTFDLSRPADTTPGMIDFVSAYLHSGHAPDADQFIFESLGMGAGNGGLWIMPAGAHHDNYANTFAQIDWGTLYEQHDGYLLFEDLKEQWKASVEPDYVLIDSRTGHTDIGGICTRQLPDSVVILFFPNFQNLRGLTKVVRDIKAESRRPRAKSIELHYVMSNVPDLDDEDKILEENIAFFQSNLGFNGEPMVIHRYDSLSLLNQVLFTKERPKSRLSREYRSLTAAIMRLNAEDRDGALEYIRNVRRPLRTNADLTRLDTEEHLQTIERIHREDGEVLFRLGLFRNEEGNTGDANTLFTRAIDAGYHEPAVYLRRAMIRRSELSDPDGAGHDALSALRSDHASALQVRRAISMIAPQNLSQVTDLPALEALSPDEKLWIADGLNESEAETVTAKKILHRLMDEVDLPSEIQKTARSLLSLRNIALGQFSEAIEVIQSDVPDLDAMTIECAFNYGMALWGENGQFVPDPFQRVIELERSNPRKDPTPNFLQCMAIANWAVGESKIALELAQRAMDQMVSKGGRELSCWRYTQVVDSEFQKDTTEIVELISGNDNVTPLFMRPGTSE